MDNRTRLQSFVERIERLKEEKAALQDDIKDIFTEAKSAGFDAKVIREILRLRAMDEADREAFEALLDVYKRDLGMLADTPLGQAAMKFKEQSITPSVRADSAP